jgi:hypothetical protein
MEATIIEKAIHSKAVQAVKVNDIATWSLFFDSGCDYLDFLRSRIKNHSVFKAQFGELSIQTSPDKAFRQILTSPHFWTWWSSQLWRVCYYYQADGYNEIYIRLMFNSSLIPQSTLKKIFTNARRQENGAEQSRMPGIIRARSAQVC